MLETEIRRWGPVDRRAMFGAQAYLVGGRMFAALGDMGLLVKLPEATRRPLLDRGEAQPFVPTGQASFGEWVALMPDQWADNVQRLLVLLQESYQYAQERRPVASGPREPRHFRKRQY